MSYNVASFTQRFHFRPLNRVLGFPDFFFNEQDMPKIVVTVASLALPDAFSISENCYTFQFHVKKIQHFLEKKTSLGVIPILRPRRILTCISYWSLLLLFGYLLCQHSKKSTLVTYIDIIEEKILCIYCTKSVLSFEKKKEKKRSGRPGMYFLHECE